MPTSNYCAQCGSQRESSSLFCAKCGMKYGASSSSTKTASANSPDKKSKKSALTALLLCLFLGALGIHRFYVGKIGTGILMLLTAGGFGIWSLIDLIVIACGNFTDKYGNYLEF